MKKIKLTNWQGYENATIDIADTLTVITGKSHHGKSSIERAIRWNRDNKPKNPRFIHKGTKKATVVIDDVTHVRTATSNEYYVKGKKDPYKALRGAVPEEVQNLINLGPENIQGQHDTIFLLKDSPGAVARKLSALVDLESTTTALQFIKSKKRKLKSEADSIKISIDATKAQLEKLEHVAPANLELSKLESEEASIATLCETRTKLLNAIKKATQAEYELSSIPPIDALQPAKALLKHHEELRVLEEEYRMVTITVNSIKKLRKQIRFNPEKLLKKAGRIQKMDGRLSILLNSIDTATVLKEIIKKYSLEEADLQNTKAEMLKGTCPLCGRSN